MPKRFIAKLCTAVTMVQVSEKMSEEKGLPNFINDEMLVVMEKQVRTVGINLVFF